MSTTGYSGTPLLQKLGIKPEMKVLLLNQPDDYYTLLETNIKDQLCSKKQIPELVHMFVKTAKEFEVEMKKLKPVCKKNTVITIWVSWYKKAALRQAQGKLATDITEDTIRNYALLAESSGQNDLVDVKVCAVS